MIVKQSLSVDIIAGPPNNDYNPISPFVWSESDFKNENHIGQPDKWDFNWYRIDHNGNMNELIFLFELLVYDRMTNPKNDTSAENKSKKEISVDAENYFVVYHPLSNEISIFI